MDNLYVLKIDTTLFTELKWLFLIKTRE